MNGQEKIAFSRHADMPFLELMSVLDTRRHFSAFHETFTVCMNMTRGGAEWRYRGKLQSGHGKMLMLMEPGEAHRTVKLLATPGSFRVLYVDPGWVARMAAEDDAPRPHFMAAVSTHAQAHQALSALCRSVDGNAPLLERETRLVSFLQAVLGHRKSCGDTSWKPTPNLLRARDYLVENCEGKIVLDDLAGASGLSKFHLVRAFARSFGMTPHLYLNHVRVSRARRLLRAGLPAGGVELGFFDQSHFIDVFRKATGVTPGRYAGSSSLKP